MLLGVFVANGTEIIGNIELEAINYVEGNALVDISIGEQYHQEYGFEVEVVQAVHLHFREVFRINELVLEVPADNARAVREFEQVGFRVQPDCIPGSDGNLRMVRDLRPLIAATVTLA